MQRVFNYSVLIGALAASLVAHAQIGFDTLRQDAVMLGHIHVRGADPILLKQRSVEWLQTEFKSIPEPCSEPDNNGSITTCRLVMPLGNMVIKGRVITARKLDFRMDLDVRADTLKFDIHDIIYSHAVKRESDKRIDKHLGKLLSEAHNEKGGRISQALADELYDIGTALNTRMNGLARSLSMARSRQGQGTCFVIHESGYLITNDHVIRGSNRITIRGIHGDLNARHEALVVARDVGNDIALLKLADTSLKLPTPRYGIRSKGVEQGERVFAMGYPRADALGEEVKLHEGLISARSGARGDVSIYQVSTPLNPGNSGGPLLDENGDLIGVIFAKSTVAEGAGYARKASYLESFLTNVDGLDITHLRTSDSRLSTVELAAMWRPLIFLVDTE